MSVIIFLLVLFVLILVHEWGHFITAKKTGMRVDEFAIGFPPRLFVIKKGETEYTFNLLPIGGFVRIFGENPETVADTADQPRSFSARPYWAQALVLVAGVTMNVIFAWFLFVATFMIGVPTAVDETVAGPNASLYISEVLESSPLKETLPAGSVVTAMSASDGSVEKPTPSTFKDFIESHEGEPVTISYLHSKEAKQTIITPEKGLLESNPDQVAVGVALALVETQSHSFFSAIGSGFSATIYGLKNISIGLYTLLSDAIVGKADFSQVAGPIGIVGLVGEAAGYGITSLLTFTAMISLNLAIINMLPIPALDGGRLVFVAIEAITRRPINVAWVGRLNLIGFGLLMLLMLVVTWNDIARLL
jgi:regulator of sigma E protease